MTETCNDNPSRAPEESKKQDYKFIPGKLDWVNISERHPDIDRWVLLWGPMGSIYPNFIVSYRDASGEYQLPHPTKKIIVNAWAYLEMPVRESV